jgi:spore maturation protein CgeB
MFQKGWWLEITQITDGLTAFYDIDTPVTLAKLERGDTEYISRQLIPRYDLYLSFTGGPTLDRLENEFGAPKALPLYCSVDPQLYFPEAHQPSLDLGYLGTYSPDRQPTLERLLIDAARQWEYGLFAVAGPQYPETIHWPENVSRILHLPPAAHRAFYCSQRFTLNVTRADMIRAGYSPSVRLFEAAACGVPVISDAWDGLDAFFDIGQEILVAASTQDALRILREIDDQTRRQIGQRARERVLNEHTAAHRAAELENYLMKLLPRKTEVQTQ